MNTETTQIKILKMNKYAQIPEKSSANAVGWDIRTCFYDLALSEYMKKKGFSEASEVEKDLLYFEEFLKNYELIVDPHQTTAIPTGLIFELPLNVEMDMKSRSGLFLKSKIIAQGTIDPDYRGEIKVLIVNLSSEKFIVKHNDRIVQAVFRTVHNNDFLFTEVAHKNDLSQTERNQKGFGSSGVK